MSTHRSTARSRRHRTTPPAPEQQPKAFFQPKLTIGQPGDQYEREADTVADAVVNRGNAPAAASSGQATVQRMPITPVASGGLQRLATPEEDKMPATNDARMAEDKQIQEKPESGRIQKMEAPKEEEAVQGKEEEEKPMQAKEEEEPMQAKEEEEQPMQTKEEEEPVQSKEEEEQPMQAKEEEEPVQAKEEEENPMQAKEEEEPVQAKSTNAAPQAAPNFSARLSARRGQGESLPKPVRSEMERGIGADFSQVRVHRDTEAVQMNKEIHAQAFTQGRDVYFNSGKYDPGSTEGKRLLAHELTHVVQQKEGIQRNVIQRDIDKTLAATNGNFNIKMIAKDGATKTPATKSGLDGTVKFTPLTTAPYSNNIGIIQIVKLTDETGKNIEPGSLPAARAAALRTAKDAKKGIKGGFFTDVWHTSPKDAAKAPQYEGSLAQRVFGFKRSDDPKDIKAAQIHDFPGVASKTMKLNFKFETVAKGEDTNTVFGGLTWGFKLRSGLVKNEYVAVHDTQSATFDEALERHRNYYVHEPVTFYFDFDSSVLNAIETSKIDEFLAYVAKFPKTKIALNGYADRKGDPKYNLKLSQKRAEAVKKALIAKGIAPAMIDKINVIGATEQFTSGDLAPNPGQGQDLDANRRGNRRVELVFTKTP